MSDIITTAVSDRPLHAFERAGLGTAPFRCVGTYVSKYQAIPGDPSCPIQPGSSCDYCGQGIMQVYTIRDAKGVEFKVGCDCVRKTGDERLKKQVAKLVTASTNEKKAERIAAARALLPTVAAALKAQPHPKKWMAEKGVTLLEWAEWMLANAGMTGKIEVAKVVEKAAKAAQ